MKAALLGKKIGMTRLTDADGNYASATVIQAGPCTVMQVKSLERDGYHAVQLGFEDVKPHRSTKPLIGHAAIAGTGPKRAHRELRLEEAGDVEVGEVLTVELFSEQEIAWVDVTAISKGRGFAGVMKRHGFGGKEASHGTERKHRSAGSIGGSASLGEGRAVKKGKRMAGQMGNKRVTVRNQRLLAVDREHNLLVVKGGVPGPEGGFVFIRQSKTRG